MAKWKLQLSTTEPNNDVGLIKINQDDENSQTFEAEINEFGNLKNFSDREVYFNAKIGPYKVRDKVPPENIYYDSNRVSYTLIAPFLQKVGEFDAWFSFKKSSEDIDEFSTTFFNYRVIPGITKGIKEGNYLWDMEELLRFYKRYKELIAEIIDNGDFSGLIEEVTEIDNRTGQLDNFSTANKQEAEEGIAPNKFMTPLRTKQAIDKQTVTITGDQEVGGVKNFTSVPQINNIPIAIDRGMAYKEITLGPANHANITNGMIKLWRIGNIVIVGSYINVKGPIRWINLASFPTGFTPQSAGSFGISLGSTGGEQYAATLYGGSGNFRLLTDGAIPSTGYDFTGAGLYYTEEDFPS